MPAAEHKTQSWWAQQQYTDPKRTWEGCGRHGSALNPAESSFGEEEGGHSPAQKDLLQLRAPGLLTVIITRELGGVSYLLKIHSSPLHNFVFSANPASKDSPHYYCSGEGVERQK